MFLPLIERVNLYIHGRNTAHIKVRQQVTAWPRAFGRHTFWQVKMFNMHQKRLCAIRYSKTSFELLTVYIKTPSLSPSPLPKQSPIPNAQTPSMPMLDLQLRFFQHALM